MLRYQEAPGKGRQRLKSTVFKVDSSGYYSGLWFSVGFHLFFCGGAHYQDGKRFMRNAFPSLYDTDFQGRNLVICAYVH